MTMCALVTFVKDTAGLFGAGFQSRATCGLQVLTRPDASPPVSRELHVTGSRALACWLAVDCVSS